jgi:DNA-binding NtrC family response regulator
MGGLHDGNVVMSHNRANILLVAERTEHVSHLIDALISGGHSVQTAVSSNQAISRDDNWEIDLVIADLGDADTDQDDLYLTLKRQYPHLPIILITGSEEPVITQPTETNGLISKHFRISHIERLIHELLEDKPGFDRARSVGAVLVVDDDDALRTMLIRSLKPSGYDARGASDGKIAIELLSKGDFGAVIADVYMPYMDGITLMNKIRRQWPHILMALISGCDSLNSVSTATENRPDGFLMKPFNIHSIDELLQDLVPSKP